MTLCVVPHTAIYLYTRKPMTVCDTRNFFSKWNEQIRTHLIHLVYGIYTQYTVIQGAMR